MSRRTTTHADGTISVRDAIVWTVPRAGYWSVAVGERKRRRSLRTTTQIGGGRR